MRGRIYKTAAAWALSAAFSAASAGFLIACFFPPEQWMPAALLSASGVSLAAWRTMLIAALGTFCFLAAFALPAVRGDDPWFAYSGLSLFSAVGHVAAAGALAAVGAVLPGGDSGAPDPPFLQMAAVLASFSALFLTAWRIFGEIGRIHRREAFRFSLELEDEA